MNNNRPKAIEYTYEDWLAFFTELGQPAYRAGQICSWIWKRRVLDPEEMTDFGKALREQLADLLDFSLPVIERQERAKDGTRKFLIAMVDGAKVETALLKQGDRLTTCISTQSGCPIGCPFCETGSSGFERNLSRGEIAAQFLVMEKTLGREINNIVFMGMGEPFLNTEAVLDAVRMLNNTKMRELGIRHMVISTAGILPGIAALAESGLGVRLAVSLHASDDELRDELVPCNTTYPVKELVSALHEYQRVTGDRVTIEYALFKDENDTIEHARQLIRLLHGLHVYVNLIPGNLNKNGYERSAPETVLRFQSVLKSAGFESDIRVERGGDINAACGQLKRSDELSSVNTENQEKHKDSKRGGQCTEKKRPPSARHGSSTTGNKDKKDKEIPVRGERTGARPTGSGGEKRRTPNEGAVSEKKPHTSRPGTKSRGKPETVNGGQRRDRNTPRGVAKRDGGKERRAGNR